MTTSDLTMSDPQMAAQVGALLSGPVPDELSALVFVEPFRDEHGRSDTGWSCREHAVVLSALLKSKGSSTHVVNGLNAFVQGPTASGARPAMLGNEADYEGFGHSWAWLDGYGPIDISPRLNMRYPALGGWWRPVDARFGVVGTTWAVGGGVKRALGISISRPQFQQQIAQGSHRVDTVMAVYWEQERKAFDAGWLIDPLAFVNSPLTRRLVSLAGASCYLKLATHLHLVDQGKAEPVGHLKFAKAWARVNRVDPAEMETFLALLA